MPKVLQLFLLSFTDLSVYRSLIQKPLRHSVGYFITLYLAMALIVSIYLIFTLIPEFNKSLTSLADSFAQSLSPTTTITLQNGTLTSNLSPITIPLEPPIPESILRNFLVIYPATASTDIAAYSTLYLATKNSLTLVTDPQTLAYQRVDWPNLPEPLTLTQAKLTEQLTALAARINLTNPYLWFLVPLATLIYFLISRFLFVALYTLPLTLIGFITNRPYRYSRLLSIGLHTVILADIINFIIHLLYQASPPAMFSLAFLGLTTIVLLSLPPKNH